MEGKRISLVTGAYGAIGKAIATGLAREKNLSVFLIGRDEALLQRTVAEVISLTGNPEVYGKVLDLSLDKEILELARHWNGPLHVLVNNAATAPRRRMESSEGIEMQWAVNVLSYYRMAWYFQPFMKGQADARIVNVASYWAGGLNLQDPEFKNRPYNNDDAYRQSKQANRMMTLMFAEDLKDSGITVNACHPGDVNSKLSNDLGFGGSARPEEGAATPLFLATSPQLQQVTGKYFEHKREVACNFMNNKAACKELMALFESYQRHPH
jgi:NAD(P)-dependent dehydrogenase (short-subunit alcohol dehydrogenase family)